MKKINLMDIYKLTFSVSVAFAIMLIGCGGGGNSARQTLPGENPTGPYVITGTGTGTNTYTNTDTNTGTGTITKTDTNTGTSTEARTPAEMLIDGWGVMGDGNFGGSLSYFSYVLNLSNSSKDERQQAFNGRGWARAKYYNIIEGLDDFKSSYQLSEINSNAYKESILGYALALIQATGDSNIDSAIVLLADELKLSNPSFVLSYEHTCIGVTSPEAHAMLAYAYFWRGKNELAKAQIMQAKKDDSSSNGIVAQIYSTLELSGLFDN